MPTVVEGYLNIEAIAPRIQGPRGGDRGFIAGRSGAGKSFLARRLLSVYGIGGSDSSSTVSKEFKGNLLIIDPNANFDYPAEETVETAEAINLHPKIRTIRYIPRHDQMDGETWNQLWGKLYIYRYPLMVYVDETRAMEPVFGQRKFPEGNYFLSYLTRGRARNKAAILGAQRPVTIPRDIIGQAEWYYVFDLPLEDDRITMAGTIGDVSADGERIRDRNSLQRFEFWFKGPDQREPVKAQIVK